MTTKTDDQHLAFHAWLSRRGIASNYQGDGQYEEPRVQLAWEAWTTAANEMRPRAAVEADRQLGVQPSVHEELIKALRNQRQLDIDGTYVGVSRQAVDEAATILATLCATPPAVEQPISDVLSDVLSDVVTQGIGIMRIDPTDIYQSSAKQRSMQAAIDAARKEQP